MTMKTITAISMMTVLLIIGCEALKETSRRTCVSSHIEPCDLFDDYDTDQKYDTLKGLMKRLAQQYGK